MSFEIDFFELMFLAESVIPDKPIARSMCFDCFSEVHYHKMSEAQREQFFEHVKKQDGFDLCNEQCHHFQARFNPRNQFIVSCFYNGVAQKVECYMFDGRYHTSKSRSINYEYIKEVIRIHDNKIIQL